MGWPILFFRLRASRLIRVFRNSGSGKYEEAKAQELGLTASGAAVACAVGDFDNDGLPDLALALTDRVVLFRNEGQGSLHRCDEGSGD